MIVIKMDSRPKQYLWRFCSSNKINNNNNNNNNNEDDDDDNYDDYDDTLMFIISLYSFTW